MSNRSASAVTGRMSGSGQQATFAWESSKRIMRDTAAMLAKHVVPAAVQPYVGRYTNEALGDITVALEDNRLVIHAGAFSAELLPQAGKEKPTSYIGIDQPVTGQRFQLTEDGAGNPVVVFGEGPPSTPSRESSRT